MKPRAHRGLHDQLSPDVGLKSVGQIEGPQPQLSIVERFRREDGCGLIHPNCRDLYRLLGSGLFLFPKPSFSGTCRSPWHSDHHGSTWKQEGRQDRNSHGRMGCLHRKGALCSSSRGLLSNPVSDLSWHPQLCGSVWKVSAIPTGPFHCNSPLPCRPSVEHARRHQNLSCK